MMSRPKKGQKGYKESVDKWRQTMWTKYGGEEGLRARFREMGGKGGHISRGGGFTNRPEFAREMGRKGGKMSRRRTGSYDEQWRKWREKIAEFVEEDMPYSQMARETGIPAGVIRYRYRKEQGSE